MTKLTESAIEDFAIKLFAGLGYDTVHGPDIAPDGEKSERSHYGEVLLAGRLEQAMHRINPRLSPDLLQAAQKEVQRIHSPDLLANNEAFHRLITEGVKVSRWQDGFDRGELVWLLDFARPENNEFLVANQFTVIENHQNKRPDLVLFVNGIPLVVIELKNAGDENATIQAAHRQLETYKQAIPSLFAANAFTVISDGLEARAGTLAKFDGTSEGRSDEELETTIRQVIDQALVSEQVIDIFDAAGIRKPDISILSDEFLAELKGHEHKNVALEVLKKLLNDELKARAGKNLVQSRSLMEMLEIAIKKYHNKILTAAEVMEELIRISKEIVASDDEARQMGLSDFEYAFYTAVANNQSARELMQHDQLRELAVVLTQRVRENASIDWTIKESVKAKLKVIVKRTLRQFGYPPDMQLLATETVLEQAKMIANELAIR